MSLRTERKRETEQEREREREGEGDSKLPRDLEDVEANKKNTCGSLAFSLFLSVVIVAKMVFRH